MVVVWQPIVNAASAGRHLLVKQILLPPASPDQVGSLLRVFCLCEEIVLCRVPPRSSFDYALDACTIVSEPNVEPEEGLGQRSNEVVFLAQGLQ